MANLDSITGLRELWVETKGDPTICIAILDGAADLAHPCFDGSQIKNIDFLTQSESTNHLSSRHGTHVASIVFGKHDSPVRGIAPDCRGIVLPIYRSNDANQQVCSQLDLARAITCAVELGAHIINISGGEFSASGVAEPFLENAIQLCVDRDVLVVAAAGNDGCRCLHVPASMSSVLAVGAMNEAGVPLDFSNWGDAYQGNGILALGENLPGALPEAGVARSSGTSYAAPVVTGVAALLMSLGLKRGARSTGIDIRTILLETADACDPALNTDCRRVLVGRLNLAAAHSRLKMKLAVSGEANTNTAQGLRSSSMKLDEEADVAWKLSSSLEDGQISVNPKNHDRRITMTESEVIPNAVSEIDSIHANPGAGAFMAPELQTAAPTQVQASGVSASECGCNKGKTPPAKAYVLGQIGYDFGAEAKRDAFGQLSGINVHNPIELLDYLQTNPAAAVNITWTLSLDATVVYAISPYGPFAASGFDRLREFLRAQLAGDVERVSIPGLISGTARLMNGQEVPVLFPDLRGLYSWSTEKLLAAVVGAKPGDAAGLDSFQEKEEGIRNFLDRIYYEIRNLGMTPQERAMNYAATNAFQVCQVYDKAIKADMKLDSIGVERSPICRPGSDCWDVKLTFFNPAKRLEQARHIYRFTVDVSEVIPVTVGKVRDWDVF